MKTGTISTTITKDRLVAIISLVILFLVTIAASLVVTSTRTALASANEDLRTAQTTNDELASKNDGLTSQVSRQREQLTACEAAAEFGSIMLDTSLSALDTIGLLLDGDMAGALVPSEETGVLVDEAGAVLEDAGYETYPELAAACTGEDIV